MKGVVFSVFCLVCWESMGRGRLLLVVLLDLWVFFEVYECVEKNWETFKNLTSTNEYDH